MATLFGLAACGNQDTASIPTAPPPSSSTPPPGPTPTPSATPTPGPAPTPLPAGEVPSTIGGGGSVTTSIVGGSLDTAEDIDAILDAIPATLTITITPGIAPVVQFTGPIRLPNGSVPLGVDFYVASISPGGLDLNEPVEDVCTPAPVPPGGTCAFDDVIPAFPGTFTLGFTFTDGAGVDYTSTRTVTIVLV
ncbi:hypothetical protein [Synechococcus sp. PCC 7336]|uniref:hypothetical protein n=1 Tax=Synechococcus sp. PCC 7336 TaxID=195250 RepID=UPI0012E9C4A9|nr:hypothetical protein [Synechococcus sp. PCC 7336]